MLAERAKSVVAVEIDRGVARYLLDAVRELGVKNVTIVNADFLDCDFGKTGANKVVSNFPYNIAVKTILKVLKELRGVSGITGMVQRETAERITAKPGTKDYAAVSVIVQFLAETRVIEKNIASGNFFPVPDVTSAVISLARRPAAGPVQGELFERVVRAGFEGRRKTLIGNLLKAGVLSGGEPGVDAPGGTAAGAAEGARNDVGDFIFRRFRDMKVRAERLSVGDFVEIARIVGERLGEVRCG
jgi:16S rRNA (adenine1518-N6/adenine1519-N6)-dimethyltransferase